MNWNQRIRRFHRWVSIVFVASIVVTFAGLAAGGPEWVSYLPLPPLALLSFSGLYILVTVFAAARRGEGGPGFAPRARRVHRWSAVVFVVTVLATFVALSLPDPLVWVSYLPLLPLAALLISGLYMIAVPYVAARRAAAA